MFPEITDERYRDFSESCRIHSRMPMGVAPSIVAAAFTALDERGAVDRHGHGYARASEFASHVASINGREWLDDQSYSDEELKAIVLHEIDETGRGNDGFSTSSSLCRIALAILRIKENESVADFGCGIGCFLTELCKQDDSLKFFGVDEYYDAAMVATMRSVVLGVNAEIEVGDMFQSSGTYDKVFSNYPLGTGLVGKRLEKQIPSIGSFIPEGIRVHSPEWVFNAKIAASLTKKGRGVGVMPLGSLSNSMDRQVREYLGKAGLLEAVIALPGGLLKESAISCALVVMSRGNKEIRFVDASDIGKPGVRGRRIVENDIDKIVRRLNSRSDQSCKVPIQELEECGWNLSPHRHLANVIIKGGVAISSLTKNITRGFGHQVKSRVSEEATPYRYLMIKDVDNGEISSSLPFISHIEKNEERYLLQDNDIVVGKMRPFKTALVHIQDGESILAGGNLYILRPDTNKVLPLYLRLAIESDLGMAQLDAHTTGTTIPSVPVSAFDEIMIPLPSIEDQQKIVARCEDLTKRAEMYERKAKQLRNEAASLLNEVGE